MMNRVAVIGGGAAGLTAAIAAAENGAEVTIYESGARVGRKILATGNGRCNMTNINAGEQNYHGNNPRFVRGAVNRFWVTETLDFFRRLGVVSKLEDEGRVYPYSDQASAVLDVLRYRAESLGVKTVCSFEVSKVNKTRGEFSIISYAGDTALADKVIIATGGKAAPDFGSKGGGYDMLRGLGHTITDLSPSLVQIKTEQDEVKGLKGIRIYAAATLGKRVEKGEILFTDYGLSGIAVFSLTPMLGGQNVISLDIMTEYKYDDVKQIIYERIANNPDITLESFFVGMFNKRIGQAVLKRAGIAPLSRKAVTLGEKEINKICSVIKRWEFTVKGTMSWNNAQTTHGGALTDEFDSVTMESKKVKGLYAAGEVLDIDGDCGGYNLQWAWSSGYLAGMYAARTGV